MNNAAVWLLDHDIQPFPLKDRAKEPACKWQQYTCSREQAGAFTNFGVKLSIAFACLDTDNVGDELWVQSQIEQGHIPATPFIVRTGRGLHRYYRTRQQPPRFIHRDNRVIEFRSEGQYVVGPGSVHPSGSVYTPAEWSWDMNDVPFFNVNFQFDDRTPEAGGPRAHSDGDDYVFPESCSSGERHHELFKLLRSMKGLGASRESAREAVRLANEHRCRPPLTEDRTFEVWFRRGWDHVDRPLPIPAAEDLGLDL